MAEGGEDTNQGDRSRDLCISYHEDDDFYIKKNILSYFDEAGISYCMLHENEGYSGPEGPHVRHQITQSKKTLLVLSKEHAKGIQLSLEMILTLEKSIKLNEMSLIILLLDGCVEGDIPKIPFLQQASSFRLYNNMHEACMRALIMKIKDKKPLNALLPAGNFAAGMAWSHFTGYLTNILPDLANHVTKCEWFNETVGLMPVCFFMLLPTSASAPRIISDVDPNVEHVGQLPMKIGMRTYTPTVYRIKDPETNKAYYCLAEYPNALMALGIMSKQGLCDFSPKAQRLEVERFYHKLEEIINHDKNRKCNGLAKCIMYDDEEKGEKSMPSYHLLKAIQHEVTSKLANPGEAQITTMDDFYRRTGTTAREDVCLLYEDHDKKWATAIRKFLQEHGKRVSIAVPGTKETPPQVQERILDSRWTLILMSKAAMQGLDWVSTYLAETLSISFEKEVLRVLPVLIDVSPSDIPDFMRWVTYIDVRTDSYQEQILSAVEGRCISMQSQIPVGDVSFGLAWAFHINYLRHVIPDLKERIELAIDTKDISASRRVAATPFYSKAIYEILPLSCNADSVAKLDKSGRLKGPWEIPDVKKDIAGTVGRTFRCQMYKIEDENDDYYFCAEIVSPTRTLKAMNQSMIAGLDQEQMAKQALKMKQQLEVIIQSRATPQAFKDRCIFVSYNDNKENLVDVLLYYLKDEAFGGPRVEKFWNFVEEEQRKGK